MSVQDLLEEYRRCDKEERDARERTRAAHAAIMAECPLRPGHLFEDSAGRGWCVLRLIRWDEHEEQGFVTWEAKVAPLKDNGQPMKIRHQTKAILPHYRWFGWVDVKGLE